MYINKLIQEIAGNIYISKFKKKKNIRNNLFLVIILIYKIKHISFLFLFYFVCAKLRYKYVKLPLLNKLYLAIYMYVVKCDCKS